MAPRLPTAASTFGARPAPSTGRAVVPINASIEAQADQTGQSLNRIGQQSFDFGNTMADAEARIRSREEAVAMAGAVSAYNEAASTELRRIQTEADLADTKTTRGYGDYLRQKKGEVLNAAGGMSAEGRLKLTERLEGIRGSYAGQVGALGAEAGRVRVRTVIGNQLNSLASSALDNPGSLNDLYASLDASIDDMAGALTPEDETQLRASGRQEITLSAVTGLIERGSVDQARTLFFDTPGLRDMMTPAQQRAMEGQFAAYDNAQREAQAKARGAIEQARIILGRDPTAAERLRIAGLAPTEGSKTPAQKLAEVEVALGRPLTPDEKERALGLDMPGAKTKEGQRIQDRELFVKQYGPNSAQVAAYDEAIGGGEKPDLSDVRGIRSEFTRLSGPFVEVRDAFNRITAASQDPSPAGDLSLIINYAKMLDPGSVVRETEFAIVQATGSLSQKLQNMGLRFATGQKLTETQRKDFVDRSKKLMIAQTKSQLDLENNYKGIAKRANVGDPEDVVVDFLGPFRKAKEIRALTGEEEDPTQGAPGTPSAPSGPTQYDLQGNPIVSSASAAEAKPKGKK